jgi:hypothetical protein
MYHDRFRSLPVFRIFGVIFILSAGVLLLGKKA